MRRWQGTEQVVRNEMQDAIRTGAHTRLAGLVDYIEGDSVELLPEIARYLVQNEAFAHKAFGAMQLYIRKIGEQKPGDFKLLQKEAMKWMVEEAAKLPVSPVTPSEDKAFEYPASVWAYMYLSKSDPANQDLANVFVARVNSVQNPFWRASIFDHALDTDCYFNIDHPLGDATHKTPFQRACLDGIIANLEGIGPSLRGKFHITLAPYHPEYARALVGDAETTNGSLSVEYALAARRNTPDPSIKEAAARVVVRAHETGSSVDAYGALVEIGRADTTGTSTPIPHSEGPLF